MFELSLEGLEGAVVAAQPPPLLSGSIQGTRPPGEASLCSQALLSRALQLLSAHRPGGGSGLWRGF